MRHHGYSGLEGFSDGAQLLTGLGISATEAVLAVPALFITPNDSDPYASSVRILDKAARLGLTKAGYKASADSDFAAALALVVGAGWRNTQWYQILERIHVAIKQKNQYLPTQTPGAPDLNAPSGSILDKAKANPLVVVGLGLGALYFLTKKDK